MVEQPGTIKHSCYQPLFIIFFPYLKIRKREKTIITPVEIVEKYFQKKLFLKLLCRNLFLSIVINTLKY